MMGELKFFLGFQIKQVKEGTFISQTKHTNDMLLTVNFRQPSHEITFDVGIDLLFSPLELTPHI
jgi:hypothetical protein